MPKGPDIHIEHPGPHSVKSLPYGDIPGRRHAGGLRALPGRLPFGDDRGPQRVGETAGATVPTAWITWCDGVWCAWAQHCGTADLVARITLQYGPVDKASFRKITLIFAPRLLRNCVASDDTVTI